VAVNEVVSSAGSEALGFESRRSPIESSYPSVNLQRESELELGSPAFLDDSALGRRELRSGSARVYT
jgi:hypothetical protein